MKGHKKEYFKVHRIGAAFVAVDTLLSELIKYFSRGWIPNHLLGMLYMQFIYKFGS